MTLYRQSEQIELGISLPNYTLAHAYPLYGLPKWLSDKEPTCQCRRQGFDSWVGKIPSRRKWKPTPIFLPRKSHGQSSLVGYSPRSPNELDPTE